MVPSFLARDYTRVPKAMSQSLLSSYERWEDTNDRANGLTHSGVTQQAVLARRHYLGAISLYEIVAIVATLQYGRWK